MKTSQKITLTAVSVIFVLMLIAGLVFLSNFIKYHNYGNQAETQIQAEYTNMENILSQYGSMISEAAQIPSMQTEDLAKIFAGTMEARYGGGGSQASFQWIQEQNPNLNQETYVKIQTMIEGGRNKFENAQTRFIDIKRVYQTNLGNFWSGFWLEYADYPKINLDDYVIISSTRARTSFETKTDDGMQLR